MNTLELLTRLKAAHGGASDYRIAQILGVKHQTVYRWKNGQGTMSDETGIRVAEELGIDPKTVVVDLHIEREAGNVASPVWKAIRRQLEMAATPVVVGVAGYGGGVLFGLPLI
ncbi:helix-turn-helix domain-containing protein [Halomonas sp. NO4]|uniref:helix-turn-helix domain-containing protein n=1 Tax=Halomonas sp. NO4 TaxID=2484813 RepID=UPI0013D714C5|nr:helix-turn-helix domain-containing protein [Halomonas sp. NO4]